LVFYNINSSIVRRDPDIILTDSEIVFPGRLNGLVYRIRLVTTNIWH